MSEVRAAEIRRRLMNPSGGRLSTELDICAPHKWRSVQERKAAEERKAREDAVREARIAEMKRQIDEAAEAARAKAEQREAAKSAAAAAIVAKQPKLKAIIEAVARRHHTTPLELVSDRREACVVLPRHIAMYLAKTMTLLSYSEIGRRMGGRDHSTVLSAVRKMTYMVESFPHISAVVADIGRELTGSPE